MAKQKSEIDFINGSLLKNIFKFAPPIMISGLVQTCFQAADTFVVGRFSGDAALAAVGSVLYVIVFFTWGIQGLSVGTDVVVAQMFGSGKTEKIRRSVENSILFGLCIGLACMAFCQVFSSFLLNLVSVPEDIYKDAGLYLRIYFLGIPFMAVYNFGAASLRAGGDTRRPTIYITLSGLLNLILNVIFVAVFRLGVLGVAVATAMSQALSAVLVLRALMTNRGPVSLDIRHMVLDWAIIKQIVKIGLPSCMQNQLFSVSNLFLTSSINSFGSLVIAGNTAAMNLESFMYISASAFGSSCLTFTSHNMGAGKIQNVKKIFNVCNGLVLSTGILSGIIELIFAPQLISIMTNSPEAIIYGTVRIKIVVCLLFLNGLMDTISASMRGMGDSITPSLTTLVGICGIRLAYLATVFKMKRTISVLYACYPISWAVTSVILFFQWQKMYRKLSENGL